MMARSRGTPAAEVDFWDREQVRAWFRSQPREVCSVMAMRSALRALPLIDAARFTPDFTPEVALSVLRACFIAWAIAKYYSRRDRLQRAAHSAAHAARFADVGASLTASAESINASDAQYAANAAAHAADTAALSDDADAQIFADFAAFAAAPVIRGDAVAIEKGGAVAEIVIAPLWPGNIPEPVGAAWDRLRTWMLKDEANHWDPWVQWYERVRDGRPSFGEAFDLAVASLTDEQWDEEPRPAAVNRRIAALLAEHIGQRARPEAETKAIPEAEPQTAPDPAVSNARQSPKSNQRGNSGRAKQTARTTIGKALLERSEQVQLALVVVIELIDEKLQQLNANRPNHPATVEKWENEKSELEKLRRIVEELQANIADYLAGAKAEKETVHSVKSFADGVREYWLKNSAKILQAGFNAAQTSFSVGLFATAVRACTAMSAGGPITTAICGALVARKPAIEALKALAGRNSEAAKRVSGRRSQTRK